MVKRCHSPMAILNDDLIDVGLLIENNIKFMADSPKEQGVFFVLITNCAG